MESFKLGQLTKELVAAKLRVIDDPCAAAAEIVHATLKVAMASLADDTQAQAAVIEDACRGGMTGLLLAEQDVARGAVMHLRKVAEVAAAHHMDPTEAMLAALRGIADLKRFLPPDRLEKLRAAVDAEFMGAGDCLRKMLDAKPKEAAAL